MGFHGLEWSDVEMGFHRLEWSDVEMGFHGLEWSDMEMGFHGPMTYPLRVGHEAEGSMKPMKKANMQQPGKKGDRQQEEIKKV